MKTILYATDFSENALNAFEFACEISKKTDAELVVLHVHDLPTIINSPANEPTIGAIEKNIMERNKGRYKCEIQPDEDSTLPKIRFEEREDDSALEGIIATISEINADLVILGTRGESKLKENLMGSTSFAVIKNSSCPVITVPSTAKYQGFKRIVYATDLAEKDLEVINELTELARMFESEIEVVHVADDEDFVNSEKVTRFRELLGEKISYANLNFEILVSKNVQDRLMSYVETNYIALISMLEKEHKNILQKWFQGDTVKQMVFNSKIPLLSYNEKYIDRIIKKQVKETEKIA